MTETSGESLPLSELISARKPRVLIVEDDPAVKQLLEISFEEGAEILASLDRGPKAIEWLEETLREGNHNKFPDLVVTDLGLGDKSEAGYEVLEAVRSRFPNCETDLITARAGQLSEKDVLDRGFATLIGKPFKISAIESRIEGLTRKINLPPAPPAK